MSRFHVLPVSIQIALLALALFVMPALADAEVTISEAAKLLPDKIESFHADGPAGMVIDGIFKRQIPDEAVTISAAARDYTNDAGSSFWVEVVRTETDSAAYALLTQFARTEGVTIGGVGIAHTVLPTRIVFCKGSSLVQVEWKQNKAGAQDQLLSISRAFAATLPEGDDEIPVLVMHLPTWQTKANHTAYAVTLNGLKGIALNQPVFDALSFEGGTEAVTADYGQAQLVIVEFTTPQFSIENDQRIAAKIQELKGQGQPVPSAYRRVGNYSVFVFNAADEKTANELIDQVKYEKVVQWLGEDPYLYERLQRYFAQTSAGVLVAVLLGSGLSLLISVGAGALFGALLFRHRRTQQAALYSDAGGAVRLNLDDLTGTRDSHRLLGPGKQSESDSTRS